MTTGAFVLSLDFELYWGMRDRRTLEAYGPRILGVRKALPRMLEAFDAHEVKATVATVGLLFFRDKAELQGALPDQRPGYANTALSPYHGHIDSIGVDEEHDPYHFGASLVQLIQRHPAHEVACHTFSHYYCLERGQKEAEFAADLLAAQRAAAPFGITLKSFVFPRNQYNARYLGLCHDHGIMAYRGNERSWLYGARNREDESRFRRALRLLDTWLPLSGPNTHAWPSVQSGLPVDVPSSRFLRPWSPRYGLLDGLKLRRITSAMDRAARRGELFHLWWHPHNFGADLERNMAFLERILEHYTHLNRTTGLRSLTMAEVAQEAQARHGR